MYSYPIDYDLFTKEEVIILIEFFTLIEDANEKKVDVKKLFTKYNEYRTIINSASLEKQMDKKFEEISGYSIFQTLKKLK